MRYCDRCKTYYDAGEQCDCAIESVNRTKTEKRESNICKVFLIDATKNNKKESEPKHE